MEQGIDPITGLQQRLRAGVAAGPSFSPTQNLELKGVDLEGIGAAAGQDIGDIQDIRAEKQTLRS